ncbi:hypothetical protein CONLIGDRAFT_106772 [Coniochaeta ligniaria NRRL 30616]|uniref:Zn(2)-C6 fungal-type domain-containing protein n=1 Tax=Coniochaeta ligniaria NRRL 30616 TaxID=1408157 RepID=A0A1J7IBF0_9PEZI|nr:hypothetical protein CONLIGDRAFT_106772 [Coniochaeta ligniaria NRRL 30616]
MDTAIPPIPPDVDPHVTVPTTLKRPAANAVSGPGTRQKRAKYTSNACTQCKKRKLKCIRYPNEHECQRCITDGVSCVVATTSRGTEIEETNSETQTTMGVRDDADVATGSTNTGYQQLSHQLSLLQQQVASLASSMRELTQPAFHARADSAPLVLPQQQASPVYSTITRRERSSGPREPQFVGPTRSAFSFRIAETSLSRMGVAADLGPPPSAPESAAGSPRRPCSELDPGLGSALLRADSDFDPLLSFSPHEILRLLDVFQEEVDSVYPFLQINELAANIPQILDFVRHPEAGTSQPHINEARQKDAHILKVAIATAIVIEAHGRNAQSTELVDSVESRSNMISRVNVDLKEVQTAMMLSIYYFHADEELLAWRVIGSAARGALEMGLHRKQSLMDNFRDADARNLAIRVFWCIYALDRRWTFGTSLSFALHDRDMDPELPEPGEDFQYLRCMVAYGRLCSKVWEVLPPFGSPSNYIPKETVTFLDFVAQNWLASIPQDLQLRHPRLGLAPCMQPRVLQRLRALLYLRGNHIRILIHRHHVLSTTAVEADMQAARNVVDIAQDSLAVLVHLNESSDIYARQQSAFNYFLVSALAVVVLAVCHAPATFADKCREPFLAALELVKNFSRQGSSSRRLWKSMRGLVPRVKSLGQLRPPHEAGGGEGGQGQRRQKQQERQQTTEEARATATTACRNGEAIVEQPTASSGADGQQWNDMWAAMEQPQDQSPCLSNSVPDALHMSVDLMNLFNSFGMPPSATDMTLGNEAFGSDYEPGVPIGDVGEISRRFQGLI